MIKAEPYLWADLYTQTWINWINHIFQIEFVVAGNIGFISHCIQTREDKRITLLKDFFFNSEGKSHQKSAYQAYLNVTQS